MKQIRLSSAPWELIGSVVRKAYETLSSESAMRIVIVTDNVSQPMLARLALEHGAAVILDLRSGDRDSIPATFDPIYLRPAKGTAVKLLHRIVGLWSQDEGESLMLLTNTDQIDQVRTQVRGLRPQTRIDMCVRGAVGSAAGLTTGK